MKEPARWHQLLAAVWLGALLTVALIATPAPFATLETAQAGRVVARVLAQEAYLSLGLGVAILVLERASAKVEAARGQASQFSTGLMLALGAIFCTVAGYFGLQPLMADARAGVGRFSFGQLHVASVAVFGLKVVLVAALAWRATAGLQAPGRTRPEGARQDTAGGDLRD